jgi:lysophospholipase L1-like esterase
MNPALFASVSGTTAAVYTNYEAVTGQSAVTTDTDCLGATLGAFNSGSFSSFDAYEVAVYEGSLTAQNITDIRNYFNTTYSLRSSSYVKNIVFEGDSISAGSGVPQAQSYPFKTLRPSLEDWRMSNFSTSGANVTTLTNRGVPTDGFYEPSYGRNVLMVLIGRNDVTNPDNSDAVYAALVAYVQARVTTGWEVWVGTCIATGAALQPAITGLNAKIRGTSGNGIITDAGANRIIDFAALPQFDTTADTTNPTYYQGDSTHPTAAGAVLLADTVAAQMVI